MATAEIYGFLMCAVVPRPIALVTTLAADGTINAAPFSSFIALSPKPPMVGFVCGGWEGRRKDTLANVERAGEFVVNIVSEAMAEAVQCCATALAPGESEVDLAGLAVAPSRVVAVPRLSMAPLAMECRLSRFVEFGDAPDTMIAGRVESVYLADGVLRNGRIDPGAWRPLARVGGGAFARLVGPFKVETDPEPGPRLRGIRQIDQ
ncbi:MAG: flavin reductase family protein [Rhodospirillaceae bacterium]|nr:flavin reductase family protein [Rhodospirillaceae bacterium]